MLLGFEVALLLGVELVLDFLPLERGIELDFVVLVACLTVVVVVAVATAFELVFEVKLEEVPFVVERAFVVEDITMGLVVDTAPGT